MGLDMYLEGRKRPMGYTKTGERIEPPEMDGFEVDEFRLKLGYWRKHANLHGYMVNTFADGVDDCEAIFLDTAKIEKTIEAIKNKQLPYTAGFFFGQSDGDEREMNEDIEIFTKALEWLKSAPWCEWRLVYYQASW